MEINNDEKIEKLLKETTEIREKIKEKIKQEIDRIDFLLSADKIDDIYSSVEKDIEYYFNKRKEIPALGNYVIENKKFFNNLLRIIFKELEILIKIRNNNIFDGEYIVFKPNESILISFLIENFKDNDGIERKYNIYISRIKLEEFIEVYEVKDDFIDRLKKEKILFENKLNKNNLEISFANSSYTDDNEKNFRRFLLQKYNLKINKELTKDIKEYKNNIIKLKQTTAILENKINNSKIEIITILGIFIGLFSYLSANFSFIKELLSNSKAIENIFLIIAVFCVGLIPVIIIFLLIKYLFLTPNDNLSIESKKLTFWKNFFPPSIIIMISIILVVAIIAIYMIFWNNYKEYNLKINKLEQEVKVKTEEIQKLEDEIKNIKIEYKKQKSNFRTKLREKNSEKFIFIN